MENIHVRDYTYADYDRIIEVWEITGLEGSRRGDNRRIIEQSLDMGGRLLVAEDTGQKKIIGTSWMTFDGRRFHLHHIGVLPEYRNSGIGTLLTRESLKAAKEKGYQIKLEVETGNFKAIDIYKKFGFKRLGDYDIYIVRDLSKIDI